jgi:phage-related protein
MTDDLTSSWYVAKNRRYSLNGFSWLFRCDLDGTYGLFLAGSDAPITYGGKTYTAFPIGISGFETQADGSLPAPQVLVSNVTRQVAEQLEFGNILDRTCQVYLYSHETGTVIDKGLWRVIKATITLEVATFSLASYGLMDSPVPCRRQERGRCDYVYGGPECRYLTTLPNLVSGTYPSFDGSTCDLTLDGANGCRAHGANEVANGKPRLHPLLFGGFPGIPKGPARV